MSESEQTELRCTFSHHVYGGAVLLAMLTCSGAPSVSALSVAIHGSIKVDDRWFSDGSHSGLFDGLPLSEPITRPQGSRADAFCFLRTPTRRVPKEVLRSLSDGLFVQADLPADLLPSFRGLHGQISYHLIVTASTGSGQEQKLLFPFRVSGRGYGLAAFILQETEVCCFPRSSLPPDHLFLRPDEFSFIDEMKASSTVYSIRDVHHICNVSFSSPVFQEDLLLLVFDFRERGQLCRLVRVKLLMDELRKDGEVLQVALTAVSSR